jgi:hypothetical protein
LKIRQSRKLPDYRTRQFSFLQAATVKRTSQRTSVGDVSA